MDFYFYGSIISGILLYINTVAIMKQVKSGQSTGLNTTAGCILVAFILMSIILLCGR